MQLEAETTPAGIAALLKLTYSGDTNAIQKQAERKLESVSKAATFVPALQVIIMEQSIVENVRSAAALYLSKECKTQAASGKDINPLLLVVVNLLESAIEVSLKRHVCNALKNLILQHRLVRLQLFGKLTEKIKVLLVPPELREFEYESVAFVAIALLQSSAGTRQEADGLLSMVSAFYELTNKTIGIVQQTLLDVNLEPVSLRRVQLLRECCRALTYVVRLVSVDETPQLSMLFCLPHLDTLFASCLQLKSEEGSNLFSHTLGKKSDLLNQLKHHVLYGLDLMMRKIGKFAANGFLHNGPLSNCSTVANLPKFCQFVLTQINGCLKQRKYYKMESKAVNLMDIGLKLLKTCLKLPSLQQLFNGCRQQLLFGIIVPLLEFNPEEEADYIDGPDDFVSYIFGIADRQEADDDQDDEWQLQITVAGLLCIFCTSQHGTLNELFEFVLTRLTAGNCQPIEAKVLLMVVAILRDATKERADLHRMLKVYLDSQLPTLLQQTTNNDQLIIRAMKLYVVHKYNFFLSHLDQSFLAITAQLSLTIIQTESLRDDQVLQIIALEIVANICDIGEIVMSDSAEQTLRALIPLIQRPVNHRLFDALQQIISSYDEKLSDEAVTQCVHELVCKIESETVSKQPPVVSNKCWNIIRVIGDNDYFIPRLITPIETEVLRLQKYLQKPEEVEFEEDFLLLCTSFIKRCKQITQAQLTLFECFSKIFERYHYTFGHMFETLSYFVFYGSEILKKSPNAVQYAVDICLKAITNPQSAKSNQSDQAQGALILQSLLVCCSEAFVQESLWNVVEIVRQRIQMNVKHQFLRGNLLAALALALVKVWKVIDRGQAELLLTMLLTGAASVKQPHSARVLVLAFSELLGIDDTTIQAKIQVMISIAIATLNRKTKATPKDEEELDNEKVEYGLAFQTYKNPTQSLNEYLLFKARFEQLQQQFPQPTAFAVAQLPKDELQFVKNLFKMEKVSGGEARVKLTVKRPNQ